MPIIACDCGAKLRITDEQARRGIECPKCELMIRIASQPAKSHAQKNASSQSDKEDWEGVDQNPLGLDSVTPIEAGLQSPMQGQQQQPIVSNLSQSPHPTSHRQRGVGTSHGPAPSSPRWGEGFDGSFAAKTKTREPWGILEIIAGLFGILHGTGIVLYLFFVMLSAAMSPVVWLNKMLEQEQDEIVAQVESAQSPDSETEPDLFPFGEPDPELIEKLEDQSRNQPSAVSGIAALVVGLISILLGGSIFVANIGMLVAGVGLLCRGAWAKIIGYRSAGLYICVWGASLFFGVMQMIALITQQDDVATVILQYFLVLLLMLVISVPMLAAPVLFVLVMRKSEKASIVARPV